MLEISTKVAFEKRFYNQIWKKNKKKAKTNLKKFFY